MTRKNAARSLLAYLNHYGPLHQCKHQHPACAIRRDGVCINEMIAAYPDMGDMDGHELRDVLRGESR